eukprot:g23993.t1
MLFSNLVPAFECLCCSKRTRTPTNLLLWTITQAQTSVGIKAITNYIAFVCLLLREGDISRVGHAAYTLG